MVMFCFDGLIRVEVGEDRWFIPDRFGIWIPADTEAQVEVSARLEFQAFQVHPRFADRISLPDRPVVLRATPLMRGIARRLTHPETLSHAERRRLGWVTLDEVGRLERTDLYLPGSRDLRLTKVMTHVLAHPQDAASLSYLGTLVGASERTLSRLFQNETGMAWRDWRDRMRFVLALEGLQTGRNSTQLAAYLGYSSVSAFVAAFRRQSGMTPSQWSQQR
jgi:AraC-like DNA-binding protein